MALVDEILKELKEGNKPTIGRYKVNKEIGRGAFAVVLEAFFDKYGRILHALKLPIDKNSYDNIIARQKVLSALGNSSFTPNLVYEDVVEGVPVIAEEYCEKSLADVIQQNRLDGTIPSFEGIVELGRQLLTGIDYFHRLGETDPPAAAILGECLPHCDIKPSNIMFKVTNTATGEGIWLYTDFGVVSEEQGAELSEDEKLRYLNSVTLDSIMGDGANEGNIFAAPEVRNALLAGDSPPATEYGDLWSIGALLFAYATGRAPTWETDPREERPDLPNAVTEFFGKLLHGRPHRRYQSAKEALEGLENMMTKAEHNQGRKGCDSYIFGMVKEAEKKYRLFKLPMFNGRTAGPAIMSNPFFSDVKPTLSYFSQDKSIRVTRLKKENNPPQGYNLRLRAEACMFDTNLNMDGELFKNWEILMERDVDDFVSYDAFVMKRGDTYAFRAEMQFKSIEWVDKLLWTGQKPKVRKKRHGLVNPLNEGSHEVTDDTRPTFFNEWYEVENDIKSPVNQYFVTFGKDPIGREVLEISSGSPGNTRFHEVYIEMPGVVDAFWIKDK